MISGDGGEESIPDADDAEDGIEREAGIVVSAGWVDAHRDEVRIVDVRDEWEFEGIGHVPGAVNVPFGTFRSAEGDEGMLPGADVWADLLGAAGVGPDDHVVAYDDTHGVFAARFLVTALLYGHPIEKLHLLDGDYSAWNREYETTTEATAVERTTYEVRDPPASPLVDFETVREVVAERAAGDSDAVILDTREPEEYAEGHVPDAVQLDWMELVDDETRGLKSESKLEAVLEGRGVRPGTPVLLYCNTARRISHTYVALRHLGYEDVAFYEGSLTEWRRRGGPVESDACDGGDSAESGEPGVADGGDESDGGDGFDGPDDADE